MPLVFENIDFTIVGHMRSLLESEGIPCEIRNAGGAGLAGEVPYTQVYPELWVLDPADEARAREIIRTYRETNPAGASAPEWLCTNCGETVDAIYAECWNCGTPAPAEPSAAPAIPPRAEIQDEAGFTPLPARDRLLPLDTLRGISLFGILLANMWGFKVPLLAYHLTENYLPGPVSTIADEALHLLVNGKFLPIFSFLFGLGVVLQQKRCVAAGRSFTPFLCGRMALLLAIGIFHGIVIWAGDVLVLYALCGMSAIWLLRLGPRTLLNLAGLVAAAMIIRSVTMPLLQSDFIDTGWRPVAEDWVKGYLWANPFEMAQLNLQQWRQMWIFGWMYQIPYTLFFFIIGIAAGKAEILQRLDSVLASGARHLVWTIPLGLALSLVFPSVIHGYVPWFAGAGGIISVAQLSGSVMLAFSWLIGFAMFFHRGHLPALGAVLADAGRMSLSNYLLQSLIGNIIFMAWGFGYYGKVSVAQGVVISTTIFIFQLFLSHWWMRKFRIGPVEALVRQVTYTRP